MTDDRSFPRLPETSGLSSNLKTIYSTMGLMAGDSKTRKVNVPPSSTLKLNCIHVLNAYEKCVIYFMKKN